MFPRLTDYLYTSLVADFYEDFGRRLARIRRAAGLSQQTLGERVGLSRTSIVNVEKGRQRVPLHMLIEFAAALGVEPTSLLPTAVPVLDGERLPAELRGMDENTKAWVLRQIGDSTKGREDLHGQSKA
jgi:transcriptional regulator with XRE-family HTH domain